MQTVGVELCTKLVQIPEAHTFVVEYILLPLKLNLYFFVYSNIFTQSFQQLFSSFTWVSSWFPKGSEELSGDC